MEEQKNEKKSQLARDEEKILAFWEENNIFQKSLEKKSPKGEFVFYDGPPFASGFPHYGHILPGSIKDAIPRYRTMRGYHVARRWGWDCHGLPVENLVEKELGLATKKDIEALGIATFNKAAEKSVLAYADDWRKIIPRTGRWIDMQRDYRTMDWTYTESVWWAFKTLYEKGLLYEGFKSMHLCPHCETTLSNFEVTQGYLDIVDLAVTVKFYLKNEPQTAFLAWTTTPWTLPGNMALAVGKDIDYVKIKILNQELRAQEQYIVAKERLAIIEGEYEIVEEFKGRELVGKEYTPPFDYYQSVDLKNKENAWKVYGASFVGAEEGTGIVHVAPAFGEDDMHLAQERHIPIVHHVGNDGRFKNEVRDFAGMSVKPKGEHQTADIEIIKNLAHRGLLFKKEKITHSYPHCWRCETPLLNYGASSWFVKTTAIKEDIIAENKKVHWVPEDIRDGRFGKWLEGMRDWAISRSRYWGAPIPVWKCTQCGEKEVVGSVDDIRKKAVRRDNTFFLIRHGHARHMVENVLISEESKEAYGLTEKGKKEILKTIRLLKREGIDTIFYSPLKRTEETALLVAHHLGIKKERVISDERLREVGFGVFEKKGPEVYHSFFSSPEEEFDKAPSGGETLQEIKKRALSFLQEVDGKYSKNKILVVSHDSILWMLFSGASGLTREQSLSYKKNWGTFLKTGGTKKLDFVPLPHNDSLEIDLHRPYIDEVKLLCNCGGRMKRVSEVFDCWFESGSMPFAQFHYPFENTEQFNPAKGVGYSADFIAESLDQTRGWFYSLIVLGTGLFGKSPFKNVVVSGLVLAEDGRKMSKRLKNYPELTDVLDTAGADALRLYLLGSPLVRAEELNFSEKGVKDVQNKIIARLKNVVAFYDLYKGEYIVEGELVPGKEHVLDRWISVRLAEVVNQMTDAFERYELERAVRPLYAFIDDFSTWYLRRSRDRFKSNDAKDARDAFVTTRYVLEKLSRAIAPLAPFVAEEVYQKVRLAGGAQSVHLSDWPERDSRIPIWPNPLAFLHRLFGTHDDLEILKDMQTVRTVVSLGLEARMKVGIKVRQPLRELRVKKNEVRIKKNEQLIDLIKDEVNVKEVVFGVDMQNEVELDSAITPELKKEGDLREFVRQIQDLRKKEGWKPSDVGVLTIQADDYLRSLIKESETFLKDKVGVRSIVLGETSGEEVVVGEHRAMAKIER